MFNSLFGNYKTTAAGALLAVGHFLSGLESPGWKVVGQALVYVAPLLLGAAAADAAKV